MHPETVVSVRMRGQADWCFCVRAGGFRSVQEFEGCSMPLRKTGLLIRWSTLQFRNDLAIPLSMKFELALSPSLLVVEGCPVPRDQIFEVLN
jgi:hypothetical protein